MSILAKPLVEKYLGISTDFVSGEYQYYCHKCNWKNPRLVVNYETAKFHCWKCGYGSSNLVTILKDHKATKDDINELKKILGQKIYERKSGSVNNLKSEVEKKLKLNNEDTKVYSYLKVSDKCIPIQECKDKELKSKTLSYLKSRDISDYEINYYDVHINTESKRVTFLTYEKSKYPVFYVERSIEKYSKFYSMPKGIKKGDIIFFEHLIDFKQEIYITEGIFDAIRIGFNAIPLLGTIMSKKLVNRMVSENTPSVGIFLDTDAYEKAVSIARYLIQKGIKVKIMHDSSFKDVGEMPKQHIENLIKKTDYLTKNSFIDLKLNLQF